MEVSPFSKLVHAVLGFISGFWWLWLVLLIVFLVSFLFVAIFTFRNEDSDFLDKLSLVLSVLAIIALLLLSISGSYALYNLIKA